MSVPALFFRCDASGEMGLGHVRRCAVLAAACKERGARVVFFLRSKGVDEVYLGLQEVDEIQWMDWDWPPERDAQELAAACRTRGLEVGVVDHYRQDDAYQDQLKKAGLKWLQFGSLNQTHGLAGRWLHDARPGAVMEDYEGRFADEEMPEGLLGPRYALLKPAFGKLRAALKKREGMQRVLITFGGGHDQSLSLRALSWLEGCGFSGECVVLTTQLNRSLPMLLKQAEGHARLRVVVDEMNPAPLMAECDAAICGGGTTLHELACCGVPALVWPIADNQVAPAKAWERAGFGRLVQRDEDALVALGRMMAEPEALASQRIKLLESQDGAGALRVAERLLQCSSA